MNIVSGMEWVVVQGCYSDRGRFQWCSAGITARASILCDYIQMNWNENVGALISTFAGNTQFGRRVGCEEGCQ